MQAIYCYTNNRLIYEFHDLTQDGCYFVNVRHPVSVPFRMEREDFNLRPNNINPQAIAFPEWRNNYEELQVIEAYNTEALQRVQQMSNSDVFPNLAG